MIVMSIVTWTLPTIGIPYMNYHIEQYLENHREITPKQYNSYRLVLHCSFFDILKIRMDGY